MNNQINRLLSNRWVQWMFVLSCVAQSAVWAIAFVASRQEIVNAIPRSISTLVGIPALLAILATSAGFLALVVAYYVTFYKKVLEHIFCPFSQKMCWIALVFAFIGVGICMSRFLNATLLALLPTYMLLAVYFLYMATVPLFFAFHYAFITRFTSFVTEIYRTSDVIERRFFVAVMLIAIVSTTFIYNQTNIFYYPVNVQGETTRRTVGVYSADSSIFYQQDAFGTFNSSSIRRPLFGLFSQPFAIAATFISWTVFFVPNSYAILIQTIQIGLLFLAYILMSRLMQVRGLTKIFFFLTLVLTYPVLVFSLVWELYIFYVFWLTVFVYIVSTTGKHNTLALVAASGSLLTNGAAFLLTLTKDWRQFFRNGIEGIFYFFTFLVLSGQIPRCAASVLGATGKGGIATHIDASVSFYDKLLLFVDFITLCWIPPGTRIIHTEYAAIYWFTSVESLNLFGLILLAFCLLGFALNYKNWFARICAFWVAMSFLVLCIGGWGANEGGFQLYTLYFGWAYFCLAFLAIEKLLQKLPAVKYTVYVGLIGVLAYINIPGIYELIQFGIEYYPVQ